MEINTLTTVLITILSVGTLSTLMYLVFTVRNLKARVKTLASEMVDFHTYTDNQEVQHMREHDTFSNDVDIRFDRVHRKVDKSRDDLYMNIERVENTLPDKIRKTIGHIEFARPLDSKNN